MICLKLHNYNDYENSIKISRPPYPGFSQFHETGAAINLYYILGKTSRFSGTIPGEKRFRKD